MTTRIPVSGTQPYEVLVGIGLAGDLQPMLAGAHRVCVIHQSTPAVAQRAQGYADVLRASGHQVMTLSIPDGEDGKTLAVAGRAWDALGDAGFTRSDAVLGVGGGAATDLAGFVAACWLRGVRCVLVPTTLLGMVDAAVGGKTGINTDAGKNLVGAFHPPAGVLCDLESLVGLPDRDFVAGMGEVVKCGFIADPEILDLIEEAPWAVSAAPARVTARRMAVVRALVERSVRVKARVVSADLRESGLREILNYGHTFAHAVERAQGYRVRHGEAVSVGLVYAAALAGAAGMLDPGTQQRHATVLEAVGLPTTYAGAWEPVREAMNVDKKTRGSTLRFVVLTGLAAPGRLEGPAEALLEGAFGAVAAEQGWPGEGESL